MDSPIITVRKEYGPGRIRTNDQTDMGSYPVRHKFIQYIIIFLSSTLIFIPLALQDNLVVLQQTNLYDQEHFWRF